MGAGEKFIGWAYARGQIQYRVNGGTVWHPLKDVYSNSSGAYSYTYSISAARYYRMVLYDAANQTILPRRPRRALTTMATRAGIRT